MQFDLLLPRKPPKKALIQSNPERVNIHRRPHLQLMRIVLVLEVYLRGSIREGIRET